MSPDWKDTGAVVPGERMNDFRGRLGAGAETFVVMFAGSNSASAAVETVIEAAALMDEKDVLFAIVSGGNRRERCQALAAEKGLSNVRFVYPWLDEEVSGALAAADLLVLPTSRSGSLNSVPSKLIHYLLSGRPVLAAVDPSSDTARTMAEAQAGLTIPPENPRAMAQAISAMRRSSELANMGRRGRAYAERTYSLQAGISRLVAIIESAAARP